MRIGSSIGLIAVGLILALAVNVDLEGLDLDMVGWILVLVGVVGLIASLALWNRSRTIVHRQEVAPIDPATGRPTVIREERRY